MLELGQNNSKNSQGYGFRPDQPQQYNQYQYPNNIQLGNN